MELFSTAALIAAGVSGPEIFTLDATQVLAPIITGYTNQETLISLLKEAKPEIDRLAKIARIAEFPEATAKIIADYQKQIYEHYKDAEHRLAGHFEQILWSVGRNPAEVMPFYLLANIPILADLLNDLNPENHAENKTVNLQPNS